MKTLVVIRHAKSSWDDPGLRDYDRPLNERGLRDAPQMGRRLRVQQLSPQLFLSSPANRALTTCKMIAEEINFPQNRIQASGELYHADCEDILDIVKTISEEIGTAFLFGHNPGLTDFVNELTDENIDNVPTCGVAVCTLNVSAWQDVEWGCGELSHFDYPKKPS